MENCAPLFIVPDFVWHDIANTARFVLPIICHYLQWSFIDFITLNPNPYKSDLVTVKFTTAISWYLLQWPHILATRYKPASKYVELIVEVFLQILLTDLMLRTAGTAIQYFLYYFCIRGYLASIVNTVFFFLFPLDNIIPISKFVRYSKTEEGFQAARIYLGYAVVLISLLYTKVHLRAYKFLLTCHCYLENLVWPIVKQISLKFSSGKKKRRSRSKRRNLK